MDQFKLKSIDELDLEFVSKSRGQASDTIKQEPKSSLIPEISKNQPVKRSEETIGAHYFQKPAQPVNQDPVYSPAPAAQQKKARPLVPIGQNPPSYIPKGTAAPAETEEDLDFSNGNYGEAKVDKPEKKKSGGGALAGKIIAIVLLAATVITFVLGCFVTIFLDNNGTDIGGICFNTMGQDIESLGVKKGDLIISKKAEISEYVTNELIAVPNSNLEGCDIQSIQRVSTYSTNDAEITTVAMQNGIGYENTVMASSCYGIAKTNIFALGSLLNFAMDNSILVCVLFILLSAFWCLLLVLIEKQSKASPKKKKVKKSK